MVHYKSIAQIKADTRGYFFERATMRFFNSIVYPNVRTGADGWFFITSEQFDRLSPRLFTVRKASENGDIDTVGKFQGYQTFDDALDAATEFAKEERGQ